MLINCLAVGAGGFIGSVFRYLFGLIPFLNKSDIPFQTLAVNVIGAVMIGMIVQAAESYGNLNGPWLLFLKVGICGGFTTFSTFSLEALGLLQSGRELMFGIYVAASLVLCIGGVFAGKMLVS